MYEKQISICREATLQNPLSSIRETVLRHIPSNEIPVRFVITRSDRETFDCEMGILAEIDGYPIPPRDSVFEFRKRVFENQNEFNVVLLVPTGIGAAIGGDSGDAGPVARLLASACDNLITHPNVVNASDINELPENGWYVEGSVITRLIMGTVALQKVRSNRIVLVIDRSDDPFFHEAAVNAASAARATLGLNCTSVVIMDNKISMQSLYSSSGRAVGSIRNLERLCEVLTECETEYDAVALSSVIRVPYEFHRDYFVKDMVNPWGGVEAMLTHTISSIFDVPSAHSPMMESKEILNLDVGVVSPQKAAEAVSTTYLHCVLKGLHRSPRILRNPQLDGTSKAFNVTDVSCLVIPDGCVGLPTLAAIEQGIPVIAVRENKNRMQNRLEDLPFAPGKLISVENYLEAVGVMNALRSGVCLESVRRPMSRTVVKEVMKAEECEEDTPVEQLGQSRTGTI